MDKKSTQPPDHPPKTQAQTHVVAHTWHVIASDAEANTIPWMVFAKLKGRTGARPAARHG